MSSSDKLSVHLFGDDVVNLVPIRVSSHCSICGVMWVNSFCACPGSACVGIGCWSG